LLLVSSSTRRKGKTSSLIEATISDMKVKSDQAERRNLELRESEEKVSYSEEIALLKKTNSQLKAQLEGIITTKK